MAWKSARSLRLVLMIVVRRRARPVTPREESMDDESELERPKKRIIGLEILRM